MKFCPKSFVQKIKVCKAVLNGSLQGRVKLAFIICELCFLLIIRLSLPSHVQYRKQFLNLKCNSYRLHYQVCVISEH